MRVVEIAAGNFFSTYGGGQVYVRNLVDQMIGKPVSMGVISHNPECNGLESKRYRGVELLEIKNATLLREAILKLRPDLIHAHSLKKEACAVGQELGIPVVVTAHHGGIVCPGGSLMNEKDEICNVRANHRDCLACVLRNIPGGKKLWHPLMLHLKEDKYQKLGETLAGKPFMLFVTPVGTAAKTIRDKSEEWLEITEKCTVMIAPSHKIADAMMRNDLDEKKLIVLPHGIPLPSPSYQKIYDEKNIIRFYYTGRVCYVKGIHILIEAFLKVNNPNIELNIIGGVGNKKEREYMRRLIKRSQGDKRIIWHGKVEPRMVFEHTRDYDVAIAPSIFLEVFGLNIAEALAQGKPVLATRCGGGEMQIEDGKNGWLVPPNDSEALAEKIRMIAQSPELINELSANCKAISIESHCEQLLEIYKDVLDAKA